MIKHTKLVKNILGYKYMTDLSDCKNIGVVLNNRKVFDEHYKFICLRPDGL